MRNRPFAARVAAIAAAGLAIRLVYSLAVMGGRTPTGDGREFHLLANVLATTGRYIQPFMYVGLHRTVPTTEKPPLYPALLSLSSLVGLDGYDAHRVLSCVLGSAAIVVIALLARRVAGDRAGLVAAALAALYPALWMLDASLRSESLYLPLIALALLLAYRLVESPAWRRAALLGAAIGLAALTRSEALLLVVLLGAPVVLLVPRPRRLVVAVALVAGTLVVVAPWLARNWATFDRPTGISTNEGGLFAGANCHGAYYTELIGTWACFPRNDPAWGENEAVISGHLRRRAIDYASDHAGRVPAVVGVRVLRVWDLWRPRSAAVFESRIADRDLHAEQAATIALYLLVPLAAFGALTLRRRRAGVGGAAPPLRILLVPLAFVTLVAALSYGSTRFRVAAEPAIVVLAAVGLVALGERWRARGRGDAADAQARMQAA
jgi:4-amino-4-deoxy-L-arabinose transferase-like glycosyltransferase